MVNLTSSKRVINVTQSQNGADSLLVRFVGDCRSFIAFVLPLNLLHVDRPMIVQDNIMMPSHRYNDLPVALMAITFLKRLLTTFRRLTKHIIIS